MSEEMLFGKLDCKDPEYLAAMEKALEKKHLKSVENKNLEEQAKGKSDIA